LDKLLALVIESLPALFKGALITLQLTALAVVFGSIGGVALGIARLSKSGLLRLSSRIYIDFFRGTPLLIQLLIIYFGTPPIFKALGSDFTFGRGTAAVIGLSLNSAAYLAEIVRAGIQSIEPGQKEAAESLGLGPAQTMQYVIFPQALRRMIPPLGNEFITLLKDTSLVAFIGYQDLLRQGQLIVATTFRPFAIYITVAFIYLAMTILSSQAFSWLERKMDPKSS
jgi:arginine/lysine/histidine/glutamine transport system substrate-binding/permease protein